MFHVNQRGICVLTFTVGMLFSGGVFADKIQIGFSEIGNSAMHPIAPTGAVADACAQLEKIYAVEDGFRGCSHGTGNSMAVMMVTRAHINQLWNKMIAAGDGAYEKGVAYYYFNQPGYTANYSALSKMYFDDLRKLTRTHSFTAGSQFLIGYMVSINKACTIDTSGIVKADKKAKLKATVLDRKTRKGDSIQYHYTINGGAGTDVNSISVSILKGRWPTRNTCEATLYADFGDN